MRSESRINLLLLLAAILLGLVIWLLPRQSREPETPPLTPLIPAQVEQISISNQQGQAFQLRRSERGWWITDPWEIPANKQRVTAFLELVATLSYSSFALPEGRLQEFGLRQPRAVIRFNGLELRFGNTHPYNHRRYVQIADTLHLIEDNFPHHFMAPVTEFVSKRLLPTNPGIVAIETPQWTLSRDASQHWSLVPAADTSAEHLVRKVSSWQNIQALRVMAAGDNGQGGSEITVSLENGTRINFQVRQQQSGVAFIRRDIGLAYLLPASNQLLESP